jgi:hypothetical protein
MAKRTKLEPRLRFLSRLAQAIKLAVEAENLPGKEKVFHLLLAKQVHEAASEEVERAIIDAEYAAGLREIARGTNSWDPDELADLVANANAEFPRGTAGPARGDGQGHGDGEPEEEE